MYLIGDIGNTDIKICLFSSNYKLIKKIKFSTSLLNFTFLNRKLKWGSKS